MRKTVMFLYTLIFLYSSINAQTTTYSKQEEKMLQYINNQLMYSVKYDSLGMITTGLDSCRRFLEKYPNSFAKPGVLTYMFMMTTQITKDMKVISPIIDSVLKYDPLAKYSIAQQLVKKNIGMPLVKKLITDIYPTLRVPYHKFWANRQLARLALDEGSTAIARKYYELSIAADSTRAEGWFEYASFLKNTEQTGDLELVKKTIRSMEEQDRLQYLDFSDNGPNINKPFLDRKMKDINGNLVDFRKFLGKPVVASMLSFWCPQKKEWTIIKKLKKDFPNITFLFIDCHDTPQELKSRYLNKPENSFLKKSTVVLVDGEFNRQFSNPDIGQIFIIDDIGNIRNEYGGYRKELEELMRKALKSVSKE